MARIRRQPPNPIFTCTTCGAHFKHRSTWGRHMRDKHRGDSICGCGKRMKRKYIMMAHLREKHSLTGRELDDAWRAIETSSRQNHQVEQVGYNVLHSVNQTVPHPPSFEHPFIPNYVDPQIMVLPRPPPLLSQRGAINYTTYETLRAPLMPIHNNLALRQGNLTGAANPVRVESITGQEDWSELIGSVGKQPYEGGCVWQAGFWNNNSSKNL